MKKYTGYAIYWTYRDGSEDTCIEYGAGARNMLINHLLNREDLDGNKEVIELKYCRIYASGEYGKRIWVR